MGESGTRTSRKIGDGIPNEVSLVNQGEGSRALQCVAQIAAEQGIDFPRLENGVGSQLPNCRDGERTNPSATV